MATRGELPTGVVTFMFTDIEGSTALVQRHGETAAAMFDRHARIIRRALDKHGGVEVNTEGDGFFCVFSDAAEAVGAAVRIQRSLHDEAWPPGAEIRVRIGLHTGIGTRGGDDYFGIDVHRAARISAAGHGGQVLLSSRTARSVSGVLPAGVSLRDLGLFRLKDLAEPEQLWDLMVDGLPSEFAPPAGASDPKEGMPERLTRFIGRERDIETAEKLLETSRLVTLTGPGGVGKTRLSMEVADRMKGSYDARFFVGLAPLRDHRLVAPAILSAVGAAPTPQPPEVRLPELLADKRWLLVLDNFEHVIDAAPLVSAILHRAPETRMLISSRMPLKVAGEREFRVRPLARHAEAGSEGQFPDAVGLFVDRALAVAPDLVLDEETLSAITEICEALDGLPLAIELAASRARVMSPTAMRQRLGRVLDLVGSGRRDLDERQRTLRNTIAWSYDLLEASDRRLLRDMAVFRGGASLDGIEGVCGIGRGEWEWLNGLERLVDQSLVQQVEAGADTRFVLLETVREFAIEKLEEAGDAALVADRHLEWFVGFAERAAAGLTTWDQGTWLAALDRERDNLRAALAWSMDSGRPDRAARLVHALWRFWQMRGSITEGTDMVGKVLALERLDDRGRMLVLEAAGGLDYWSGDMEAAARRYGEAVSLARAGGSKSELAHALYNEGIAVGFTDGGAERGIELLTQSLAIGEELGDPHAVALARWGTSAVVQTVEEISRAHELLLDALDAFELTDDAFMVHWTLRELGVMEIELGMLDEAEHRLRSAMEFFSSVGDLSGTLLLLRDAARLRAARGDTEGSLLLIGAAVAREEEVGLVLGQFELASPGHPDTEQARVLLEKGGRWTLEESVAFALS